MKHLDRVAALGCLVCGAPAEIHHAKLLPGQGREDALTVPLCPRHHRTGGYGVAYHAGRAAWEARNGTMAEAVSVVYNRLGESQ